MWAKAIALTKSESDKGVGDTVERRIGKTNSQAFKDWYAIIFGKSCGCSDRQIKWNQEFPY